MKEVWRNVIGYEDSYEVSNTQKIRNKETKHVLKPYVGTGNYRFVHLWKNGTGKNYSLARIVAFAFPEICGEWSNGSEIDHINTIRSDNRPENLRWVRNRKENMDNPETQEKLKKRQLKNHPKLSKWVIKLSLNNEILHFYPSLMEAQRQTGAKYQGIMKCCKGERQTAGGFIWKYSA